MNRKELIEAATEKSGLPKKDIESSLSSILAVITEAMAKDDNVSLVGFGTFSVRVRSARDGRNPKTGEPMKIQESKTVGFKAGKTLKDSLS